MSWRESGPGEVAGVALVALALFCAAMAIAGLVGCSATQRRTERTVVHLAEDACLLVEPAIPNEDLCLTTAEIRSVADELLARRKAAALQRVTELLDRLDAGAP